MTIEELIAEDFHIFCCEFPQWIGHAEKVAEEYQTTPALAAVIFMRFLDFIGGDDPGGGEEVPEFQEAIAMASQFLKRAA